MGNIYIRRGLLSDYGYWKPIVLELLDQADYIEIHCFAHEIEKIEVLSQWAYEIEFLDFEISFQPIPEPIDPANLFPKGKRSLDEEGLYVFRFKITDLTIEKLIYEGVNPNRSMRWFTLFLCKNKNTFLSVEHGGSEFYGHGLCKDSIKVIKYFARKENDFSISEY